MLNLRAGKSHRHLCGAQQKVIEDNPFSDLNNCFWFDVMWFSLYVNKVACVIWNKYFNCPLSASRHAPVTSRQ